MMNVGDRVEFTQVERGSAVTHIVEVMAVYKPGSNPRRTKFTYMISNLHVGGTVCIGIVDGDPRLGDVVE